MEQADIGVYGLGVMGRNIALNLEEKGYRVSLFNRTVTGKEENVVASFLTEEGKNKNFIGPGTEDAFIASLQKPRKILMMVKAGEAVDKVIGRLAPRLHKGDLLIDGGNSHFKDTIQRLEALEKQDIYFIGMGVSGGEEGARFGPSLMPGGSAEGWPEIETMLKSIAAKDDKGQPCCTWVGGQGAGHFVKMVHNGIEYADMQLIAECYHTMKVGLHMSSAEIADVFASWNQGLLGSYLMNITSDILKVEASNGTPLVNKILDTAGQKGTGRWTAISALELGTPLPVITSAVFGRVFSSLKSLREGLAHKLGGTVPVFKEDKKSVLAELRQALLAARVVTLAEGFFFIQQISDEYSWNIDHAEIARIWQNGCIIRSALLKTVRSAFLENPGVNHLLNGTSLVDILQEKNAGLRTTIARCVQHGIPCPGLSNALAQYDSIRSGWLPANLIQAQRDYFGAHTYERIDRPRGQFFHTDWKQHLTKS